jgi:hypothetical protein
MSYSVYFFAMNSALVVHRFQSESEQVICATDARIRREGRFSDEDVRSTVAKARAICSGSLSANCDAEYFHALCWLAEVVSEKITIPSYLAFRRISYLTDIGIWPLLQGHSSPSSLPQTGLKSGTERGHSTFQEDTPREVECSL